MGVFKFYTTDGDSYPIYKLDTSSNPRLENKDFTYYLFSAYGHSEWDLASYSDNSIPDNIGNILFKRGQWG